MKKYNFLICLVLCPIAVIGQQKYFTFDEVKFETSTEKRIVRKYLDGDGSVFTTFLAVAPEDSSFYKSWEKQFENELTQLRSRKVPKKRGKDIQNIYNELHEKFLRKYEVMSYFDQIFENGVYNCVTAVALYALTFDHLGIPFSIKETPTHVYIVADPDDSQLLIETTDPVSGFKSFSPGFKERFVTELAMMKIVDQQEVENKGLYPIFDEYYFGGEELSVDELLGLQYYNKGVLHFNDGNYSKAWKALAKAQLFHTNRQIDDMLLASVVNHLTGTDYTSWEDIKLLPFLARFEHRDVRKQDIVGEFNRMTNLVLVEQNNPAMADSAYNYFISKTEDDYLKTEVSFYYNYERGRIRYNRAYYEQAFDFFVKAYQAKPGHVDTESLLIDSFRLSFRNEDTEKAIDKLEGLMEEVPEIANNNRINEMQLNLYLAKMGEEFEEKRVTSGNKLMELFESKQAQKPRVIYDEYLLSNAYSKAAVYYFRKGYTSKARSIIQRGLGYVPDSYELKTRLRMINN